MRYECAIAAEGGITTAEDWGFVEFRLVLEPVPVREVAFVVAWRVAQLLLPQVIRYRC